MNHFLRSAEVPARPHTFDGPRAAVTVRVEGERLVMTDMEGKPSLCVAKADTLWAPLPERYTVVAPTGEVAKPTKGLRFYVTLETFNPYHLVAEGK